ncbi:MAG: hypothetical protein K9N07_09870 [Candidatus Cloacimonetes bacterium]|nr:hypothetical protein [Candidatus Cloacimonadota bacterium]
MSQIIKINARFVCASTGKPLTGKAYKVRIYDKDILVDDLMGEAFLNDDGKIELITSIDKADSLDSPGETKPDIYFKVYKDDKLIYTSNVFQDVDFLKKDEVTGLENHLTQFFGVFKVNTGDESSGIESVKGKIKTFSLMGRVVDKNHNPISGILVTILDKDLIFDDLMAMGTTGDDGIFLFNFTTDEFRLDFLEFETTPDIYCYFSLLDDKKQEVITLKKQEFFKRKFNQEEDLGDIVLDNYLSRAVPEDLQDIEIFELDKKAKKRLNITEDLVESCVNEVLPLVEQATNWHDILDGIHFEIINNKSGMKRIIEKLFEYYQTALGIEDDLVYMPWLFYKILTAILYNSISALYFPGDKTIYINNHTCQYINLDYLKVILGHEIVHAGQFKSVSNLKPALESYLNELLQEVSEDRSATEVEELEFEELLKIVKNSKIQNAMTALEGHAYFIQKEYLEKHYNCATGFNHSTGLLYRLLMSRFGKNTNSGSGQNILSSLFNAKGSQYIDGYNLLKKNQGMDFQSLLQYEIEKK